MRIAVIGAPGAGKTKVAKSMARALNRDGTKLPNKTRTRWKVIDGYVEALETRTGTRYGPFAGYVENVSVTMERWILEDEANHHGYHTITCGSLYDSFTYAAMLNFQQLPDEQSRLFQAQVVTIMMNFFRLIEPAGRYDHVFFLPWEQPGNSDLTDEKAWYAVVNDKLPDILSTCSVTATALVGSPQEKTRDALKITRLIWDQVRQTEEASLADQSGV